MRDIVSDPGAGASHVTSKPVGDLYVSPSPHGCRRRYAVLSRLFYIIFIAVGTLIAPSFGKSRRVVVAAGSEPDGKRTIPLGMTGRKNDNRDSSQNMTPDWGRKK